MAEKNKLSKEVEEQIKSLASDVCIQIEEKLTQLICTVTPKKLAKQVNIEQSPAYLALQDNYQASQNELAEKNKSLSEQIYQLEQKSNTQTKQLEDEIDKEEESKLKGELHANSLAEHKNEIKELTKQLAILMNDFEQIQKQHQQQTTSLKQELEQKSIQLNEQLQQSQVEEKNQQKVVTDQQVQLVELDGKIKQKIKEVQDSQQEIKQLHKELSQIKEQQLEDRKTNDLQHQQVEAILQKKIYQLEIKNQELSSSLVTEQADITLYQKEVSTLKSQVELEKEGYENVLNRFNINREKQEKDNHQVRETIKYLRDENSDMITQNNRQKEGFVEQINELEHKLTEYRLKFEYAQKQLAQNS